MKQAVSTPTESPSTLGDTQTTTRCGWRRGLPSRLGTAGRAAMAVNQPSR